jgi:hypothetical protein
LEKIRRLRDGFKNLGLEYLLLSLSWRLPRWLFNYDHGLLYAGADLLFTKRDRSDIVIRLATAEDADGLTPLGLPIEVVLERMNHGDTCVVAVQGDEIVSMEWAATGSIFIKSFGSILDTTERGFYVYNGFTLSRERGQGLFIACCVRLFEHYAAQIRGTAFGAISAFNTASIKVHERSGFHQVGETVRIILMGVSFLYTKKWPSSCPRLQIGFLRQPQGLRAL